MVTKQPSWLKEHAPEILVLVIGIPALTYAVRTSYQSQVALDAQASELTQMQGDLREIKQSLVSVLLDKNPNKAEIIGRLVSDAHALEGARHFEHGEYGAALAIWRPSAASGNKDSAVALQVATAALRQRAADANLSQAERLKAQAALAGMATDAGSTEEHDGK